MTDQELIQALKCCGIHTGDKNCGECPVCASGEIRCKDLPQVAAVRLSALSRVEAEWDAAVADLNISQDCRTCGNKTSWCNDNPDACKGYKWRGAQEEDGQDG